MKSKGTIFGIRHEETQMSTVKTLNSNWGQAMYRKLVTYRDKTNQLSSQSYLVSDAQLGLERPSTGLEDDVQLSHC